jgi:hypothetical protein
VVNLTTLNTLPGVRRDGTAFESNYYRDSVWMRFQRGLPRKMKGYRATTSMLNSTVRAVHLDARGNVNTAHYFSQFGVAKQELADNGGGGALLERTPLNFDSSRDRTWTAAAMYSSTGGAYSALLMAATPDVADLAEDAAGPVYSCGLLTDERAVAVSDSSGPLQISGGVAVLQPFLFLYGSNGLIRNSNANDFSTATGWAGGGGAFANSANVAATKIVYGAPVRGGSQSPAGLFWALDSLIRVSFVGGAALWNYDTLSSETSIVAKRSVVEIDGKFFWPGTDRFFAYNGVVQELPNQLNANWFFDNLNRRAANKIWGTAVKRWGEIWWFFPFGDSTECDTAVIYNYRENTWYDVATKRSAGSSIGQFRFPVWVGAEDSLSVQRLVVGVDANTAAPTIAGNAVLNLSPTTLIQIGFKASGLGVPINASVIAKTSSSVTLSAPCVTGVLTGVAVNFTSIVGVPLGNSTFTGATSGASGSLVKSDATSLTLKAVSGAFLLNEVLSSGAVTARVLESPAVLDLTTAYLHETGLDKVVGAVQTPIVSSVTTSDFGVLVAGSLPDLNQPRSKNATRVVRVEPDFKLAGVVTLEVLGRDGLQQEPISLYTTEVGDATEFVEPRVQARLLNIRLTSNALGGDYEAGKVIIHLEPGDERSGVAD